MRRAKIIYPLLAGMAVLTVAGLSWQRHVTERLRDEVARQRVLAEKRERLREEQSRLVAQQVAPAEQSRRREEREQLTLLLAEVEGMRRRANQAATAARSAAAVTTLTPKSLRDGPVPVEEWRNAGRAEPVATFETTLWAAAGGDLDALADALLLDDDSRAKAAAFFARQPAALQREVGTPEKLIALLAAKDVPLGAARVIRERTDADQTKLTVRVEDPEGKAKQVVLGFKQDTKGWRVVVPPKTVDEYVSPKRPNSIKLDPMTVATPSEAIP